MIGDIRFELLILNSNSNTGVSFDGLDLSGTQATGNIFGSPIGNSIKPIKTEHDSQKLDYSYGNKDQVGTVRTGIDGDTETGWTNPKKVIWN